MADFWIKLEKNTPDKPEIFEMAEILALDPDAVLGKLIRVWCWVDSNSSDGHIKSVTPVLIDRLTMSQGFADAMTEVGWLKENSIPNFNRHLGESAKKRAKDSERKRMSRVPSEDCPKKTVTESGLDKSRVDKSRVDKNKDLFDLFWMNSTKRGDKKKAYSYFNKILNKKDSPQEFTDFLINDIKQRKESGQLGFDQMHITTYLNGERFDDEIQLGESNGPNRFAKPSKETALERMARKQKAMDAGAEASGHYETVLGQNDSIISTQVYDH
jgi:hypothetical protein